MQIVCEYCQSKIQIPNGKIPPGKTASLSCPKCKKRISVTTEEKKSAPQSEVDISEMDTIDEIFSFEDEESEDYDASEKPFDFVEEEGKTALLSESDAATRKKIATVLEVLEYHITEPKSGRDALKQMRYHNYNLIVVNENFDTNNPDANGILIYLERISMSMRRNIFVVLLSKRYRTMDQMVAFQKSVNMVVNMNNIDDFDRILRRGLADNDLFFRIFKETFEQ
jgi:CheY-like chemotaxis protein/DNA-directed RNA polymerase subunit RPC12/RpoP